MFLRSLIGAVALGLVLSVPTQASTVIIDTLNTRIGQTGASAPAFALINLGGARQNPLGQSFVLAQATRALRVEAKFLSFGTTAANAGFAVDFLIFSGAGVTGQQVGSVRFDIPGAAVAGRTVTSRTANFSAFGTFAAGTFTAAVRGDGVTNRGALLGGTPRVLEFGLFGREISPAVNTAGTDSFGPTGVFNFGTNLSQEFGFRVTGIPVAPIPLPAGGLMLALALAGLGLAARRRA